MPIEVCRDKGVAMLGRDNPVLNETLGLTFFNPIQVPAKLDFRRAIFKLQNPYFTILQELKSFPTPTR